MNKLIFFTLKTLSWLAAIYFIVNSIIWLIYPNYINAPDVWFYKFMLATSGVMSIGTFISSIGKELNLLVKAFYSSSSNDKIKRNKVSEIKDAEFEEE